MARSSKKRKNKAKFKWTKELIFMICFILVLGVATGLMSIESKADKLYEKYTNALSSTENTALTEDNVFEDISYNKILKKISSSDYTYVYYGSVNVSDFLANLQAVNAGAKDYGVSKVYILDSSWAENLDTEDEDEGEENQAQLEAREEALGGVELTSYPQLWVYKDNEIVFNSLDKTSDPYQPATWTLVINNAFSYAKLD